MGLLRVTLERLHAHFRILWGYFGVTLRLLGGIWGALEDHWELVGASLGEFWGLEMVWRKYTGAYEGHCGSLERYG